MSLSHFHPAVRSWFESSFEKPTDVQEQSWNAINQGKQTLLAAPTGSGKTLAAFLSAIDQLIKEGLKIGGLEDETRVLYISPLKALSNDIQINLQQPLQGIRDTLLEQGQHDVEVRACVRTGDTPQTERAKAIRTPPHILVTTPESIYILLSSESGRKMLSTVETVIIDEIHAIAGSKRGSHLMLSLERLEALISENNKKAKLQRIGLSATQKPIELMADFLLGRRSSSKDKSNNNRCAIIDTGHSRKRDLAIEVPLSPLSSIMANEVWDEIYQRLEFFSNTHKTMLVFVNTRRLAERVAKNISERLNKDLEANNNVTAIENVMAHHGSMSKDNRLEAEQRLKRGELKCLVATASLELGIDIGDIDLVVQIGSPRSISAFLQRVGRSGHKIGATPKGRLFPLSRDELVECTALIHAANNEDLDRVIIPHQPLDVLAQQVVAEVSNREWQLDDLYKTIVRAMPYAELPVDTFEQVIQMLADGYSTRRGRRGAYLHYDAINRRLRPRKSARIIALTNGGAIPDQFDCDVMLQPEGFRIGTVGEDFAFESLPGDIFQLGNRSYRILKSETGKVFVEDANGIPPNIPFWVGDAYGRSNELSDAVSALRVTIDDLLDEGEGIALSFAQENYALSEPAAKQLIDYLHSGKAALGLLPTQKDIIFERFFDEVGDMHFVIHSAFGSRINKAWGLALRKRFCRKFNFELQAAALEDSIVLSLSSTHSFPLEEVTRYLHSNTVREVLIQAMLDAPVFPTRWRWNATISLAVLRNRFGRRSPPYFQRSDAEDLMAVVFPDQIACLENIAGEREIPNHPLVEQTIKDCLNETMDVEGLISVIQKIESGEIKVTCCDLTSPSPLAQEVISAKPYAFLDDGEAEERRTMAIKSQPFMDIDEAAALRKLDPAAIETVKKEAWPLIRTEDELHDALMVMGFLCENEQNQYPANSDVLQNSGISHLFEILNKENRAVKTNCNDNDFIWIASERLLEFIAVFPEIKPLNADNADNTVFSAPPTFLPISKTEHPLLEIIRSRLEVLGPTTAEKLAKPLGIDINKVDQVLLSLEQEGFVIQGHFTQHSQTTEWCERRLLARIHRYNISRLRREIEPVSLSQYMQLLFEWQGLTDKGEGIESLAHVLEQLEGISASADAWQSHILPNRIKHMGVDMLDNLCISGRFNWLRLNVIDSQDKRKKSPIRHTPIALIQRQNVTQWQRFTSPPASYNLSPYAQKIINLLNKKGAMFFFDIVKETGMLRTQVEEALGECVNWGLVTSDAYVGLRALITRSAKRPKFHTRRGRSTAKVSPFDNAGRWSLITQVPSANAFIENEPAVESRNITLDSDDLEFIAWSLLNRFGVLFRKVLEREHNLPPWRDLLRVFWRLEARGEIRGGRFVNGVSGEQFALPEALTVLKKLRKNNKPNQNISISSADPLNLVGIILPGEKIPITPQRTLYFVNGTFVEGKDVQTDKHERRALTSLPIAVGKS